MSIWHDWLQVNKLQFSRSFSALLNSFRNLFPFICVIEWLCIPLTAPRKSVQRLMKWMRGCWSKRGLWGSHFVTFCHSAVDMILDVGLSLFTGQQSVTYILTIKPQKKASKCPTFKNLVPHLDTPAPPHFTCQTPCLPSWIEDKKECEQKEAKEKLY